MGDNNEKKNRWNVRRLETGEQWKADLVQAVCFEFPFDLKKAREEQQKEENLSKRDAENERIQSSYKVKNDCWGCFDEKEKLLGSITVSHFPTQFDGQKILMGGIGGVSTLPQYRHGGVIRRCFSSALEDMYENGFVYSALYPFSTAYYRKFGYENNACVCEWTVSLDALPSETAAGSVEQLFPGDDLSPLLEVYRKFYQDCNLAVERKIYDPALEKENVLEQKRYIYLWRDEKGEPGGFMIAQKTDGEIFDCTTGFGRKNGFLALHAQAYQGMLAFVKNSFSAYYKSIRFAVPETIRPDSFFTESNHASCRSYCNGMVRIINVEKALSMCRCLGNGSLKIQVEDGMLLQNRGTWKLTFAPGKKNQVEKTSEQPDLILGIGALSALLCGARTAGELIWMPNVRVENPDAPLSQVFYRKMCHILELF